jgi:hypothetical protein
MSLTVAQLNLMAARPADLEAVVKEQLRVIDDKLGRAEKSWGECNVDHELPTAFPLRGLAKADSQLLVYNGVIESLEGRGFTVGLDLGEPSMLHISWVTRLDQAETEAYQRRIKKAQGVARDMRLRRDKLKKAATTAPPAAPAAPATAPQAPTAPTRPPSPPPIAALARRVQREQAQVRGAPPG